MRLTPLAAIALFATAASAQTTPQAGTTAASPHAGHVMPQPGAAAPATTGRTPPPADPATPDNHSATAGSQPAAAPGNANARNPDPR